MEYDIWTKTMYYYVCYDGNIFSSAGRMMSLVGKWNSVMMTLWWQWKLGMYVLLHFCQALNISKMNTQIVEA